MPVTPFNFIVGTTLSLFVKFSKMIIEISFLISFVLEVHHMLQELWSIFPLLR